MKKAIKIKNLRGKRETANRWYSECWDQWGLCDDPTDAKGHVGRDFDQWCLRALGALHEAVEQGAEGPLTHRHLHSAQDMITSLEQWV